MNPVRVQLSRRKGWKMPPNTVKVDRTTPWGNPFVASERGPNGETPTEYAVLNFARLMAGYVAISEPRKCIDAQNALLKRMHAEKAAGFPSLRGKSLACWCKRGSPCHADVLLEIANAPQSRALEDVELAFAEERDQ